MTLNARVTELAAMILALEGIARTVGVALWDGNGNESRNDSFRPASGHRHGAGKGLGRAYALDLAARGARVLINNRRRSGAEPSSADEVVQTIRQAGGEAVANYDSVEDPGAGERIVQQALDAWGRIDVLVNNAGVDQRSSFHKVSVAEFERIFAINFHGSLYVTHAAYARMRAAGYGRIVVSTSNAGLHGLCAYAASKAALIGFMRALAIEGKSHNVLTNAIAPFAATPMTARQGN